MLTKYQRHLYYYRKRNGDPLSTYTQNSKIAPVKSFFLSFVRSLIRAHYILFNPASELPLTKYQRRLPRAIFSLTEV
jgi:integrase/recombinase XerD